jgi:hypothetical protein
MTQVFFSPGIVFSSHMAVVDTRSGAARFIWVTGT